MRLLAAMRLALFGLILVLAVACAPTATTTIHAATTTIHADMPVVTGIAASSSAANLITSDFDRSSAAKRRDALQLLTVSEPHRGAPAYKRAQWKHWIDEDGDCQDTRQEVLIAESLQPVTFSNRCRVATGLWLDEYTGTTTTKPSEFDIDHFVPLENAHISGGWAWTTEQKKAYANDLIHPEHLIAVLASANRSKSSHSPDEWKPPHKEYWCEYAVSWISVKNRWSLTVTMRERDTLGSMLDTCPVDGPPQTGTPSLEAGTAAHPALPSTPQPSSEVYYVNCAAARAAGAAPIRRGQPGYRAALDGDRDGVACE